MAINYTFPQTASFVVDVDSRELETILEALSANGIDIDTGKISFDEPNKGDKVIAIYKAMESGEIDFAEPKAIAAFVGCSEPHVSTIREKAIKRGASWALHYETLIVANKAAIAAQKEADRLQAMIDNNPQLAAMLAAKLGITVPTNDSESANA